MLRVESGQSASDGTDGWTSVDRKVLPDLILLDVSKRSLMEKGSDRGGMIIDSGTQRQIGPSYVVAGLCVRRPSVTGRPGGIGRGREDGIDTFW